MRREGDEPKSHDPLNVKEYLILALSWEVNRAIEDTADLRKRLKQAEVRETDLRNALKVIRAANSAEFDGLYEDPQIA